MPRQAHELSGIFMPDFNQQFSCGFNPDPSAIIKLQAIAVSHRNRLWKIKQ